MGRIIHSEEFGINMVPHRMPVMDGGEQRVVQQVHLIVQEMGDAYMHLWPLEIDEAEQLLDALESAIAIAQGKEPKTKKKIHIVGANEMPPEPGGSGGRAA